MSRKIACGRLEQGVPISTRDPPECGLLVPVNILITRQAARKDSQKLVHEALKLKVQLYIRCTITFQFIHNRLILKIENPTF